MKRLALALALVAAPVFAATTTVADWQEDPTAIVSAADVTLDDFKWLARPLIVFADSPLDPAFIDQMSFLETEMEAVVDRDIVIIVDADPSAKSDLRDTFHPNGFALILLGKDGGVKLRKPFPWDMREISRTIDKMPMRQREIEERRAERAAATE